MNLRSIARGFVNRAVGRRGMGLAYSHVLERPDAVFVRAGAAGGRA